MATTTTSSTSGRLKAREVAMLQRALDTERATARAAQERSQELQHALDSERSAVRALRREVAGQVRSAREQEAKKCAALLDQMRTRMELTQAELLGVEREQLTRTLTAQFQRELQGSEEAWRKATRKLQEGLQDQLREAQRNSLERETRGDVEALVHSLHTEFQRNLHQKQDQWKHETKAQVDALTNQLRELQRLYTETCNQLTITTNEAETIPKLRQDNQTLKLQNKDLEEKIQMLMESDKRKVEQFRTQHEENNARIAELQRAARKETFQLLEELKSKERMVAQLQREYHLLAGRQSVSPRAGSRTSVAASGSGRPSNTPDRDSPGEPPRMQCIKRPKNLAFASDWNKRLRAQEGRKPPDPPEPEPVNGRKEGTQESNEELSNRLSEPIKNSTEGGITDEVINNNWTKTVGVETLYKLLLEEHQELQKAHHQTITRLREEEKLRLQLEEQLRECRRVEGDNTINIALAEQIQALQERQVELESEAQELREQNDLLEFRILELDDVCSHSCTSFHFKSPSSRSPDTRERESDDVSDSGVMSLPTSEDISEADYQDYKMEPNNRDVKSKLAQLCQSLESVSDRISVQQGLALLRHYETRLENLEATLAAMCQEATQTKSYDFPPSTNLESGKSPSRIIATVLPFTDLSSPYPGKELREELPLKKLLREQDCMQESGIFEESGLPSCLLNIATQTDWTFETPPGDLGAEIRKLTQIRERIEEKGGNRKLLKNPEVDQKFLTATSIKELIYYRDRVQILEDKLVIYESKGDDQSKLLARRLEKEVLLAAQVKHLQRTVKLLKEENRLLDEERCEFEEAENDTRLRCQKLEVKLSALGEKKSDLQVQLQQNARSMSNLRSSLSEEERKRNEARQYAAKMEAFSNRLEQQIFEMEEREMETTNRLHTLESVVPAMVMFYLWRMLNTVRPLLNEVKPLSVRHSVSDSILAIQSPSQNLEKHKKIGRHKNLDETSEAREILRKQIGEAYKFLNSKPLSEPSSKTDIDEAFLLIEMLTERCHAMEERIKELEHKERNYEKFVQNGDEQLVNLELEYKHQIKCLEEELLQKQFKVDSIQNQLKKQTQNQEIEQQYYIEQMNQTENEVAKLKDALNQKEKEKKAQEGELKRLIRDQEETLENMERLKTTVEKPLRDELESQKKKVRDLLGDIDLLEQEKEENKELQNRVVNELKRINSLACRDLEESEVTISELREEVMTLELEVQSLRKTLSREREVSEIQLLQAGEELEALRSLGSLGGSSEAGSLHEELAAVDTRTAECPVDSGSTADASVPRLPPVLHSYASMNECQKAEQAIKDFDPSDLTLNSLDQVSTAYLHSRMCRNCKNTTVVELRGILNLLQKTAPQNKMVQTSPSLLYPSFPIKGSDQSSPSFEVAIKETKKREQVRGSSQTFLHSLYNKLRVKDHMIRCLGDHLRTCPWPPEELSTQLSLDPPHTFDFTRSSLLQYINDQLTPRVSGLYEGENDSGYSSMNPLLLRVTRQQDPQSLYVMWTMPSSNFVTGFQITVEGQMTERIYSAARNSALLSPLNLLKPVTLTIQALQSDGEVVQEHSIRYPPSSTLEPTVPYS